MQVPPWRANSPPPEPAEVGMRRISLFALILLAGSLLQSTQALAESPPVYLFSWNTGPAPSGIVVRPSGTYVVNQGGQKIQQFTSLGMLITEWGTYGTGDGEFRFPYGIAADQDGNLYVTDRENYRIQKFSSAGTYLAQWGSQGTGDGQFLEPRGIAVGPDGDAYVVDAARVQKFSTAGDYLAQWGTGGQGPGEFNSPLGIAVDAAGDVYVTDFERIQKFTSAGAYIAQWGYGQLSRPEGVAVDGDSVYISEAYANRIQKFTREGAFLSIWGSQGNSPGRFSHPAGLAIGDNGHVYVTDYDNNRVQVFGRREIAVRRVPADYASIQAAVAAAGEGDTVLVAPGTYQENVDFAGKALILASEFVHGADVATIAATVIDGGGSRPVLYFHTGEDTTTAVVGFTIRNGRSLTGSNGGGVYCSGGSPRLEHLIVRDNVAHFGGGGIGVQFGQPQVYDCTITANAAGHGGGIWGGGVIGTP